MLGIFRLASLVVLKMNEVFIYVCFLNLSDPRSETRKLKTPG